MPELPEVETTLRGIRPHLEGRTLKAVTVRESRLRWPVSDALYALKDCPVIALRRRAKYLLIELEAGQVMIHLGMSGTLRVVEAALPLRKHDHVDLLLDSGKVLRFNDPRRFGSVLYQPGGEPHALLAALGPEPLGEDFHGNWLFARSRGRKVAVKSFIMDNATVVGVGNIYAQESLFIAGIHPSRAAGRISRERYKRLADAIRVVLARAIEAGGTTLKDFTSADGQPGYFAQSLNVYGRAGQPCPQCEALLKADRHGQRSTSYCPQCQR
ncbi:bifunctional DNA-formamidopyrimidine glycosylase/DNA-(apurinic or apyrimidinic site) lyase [Alcanivorax sp. IL3]|jgi:formamidopyrimidine-DNA glycosylase|uniref:bifunctional DNA-formamidopyrimidine glycosylase/DNA-(apurinic or apyrimidinic site) lyase n=1 Tax=Alcanivorax TaxID=59753 RepID=UPI000C5E5CC7|nr:MULTISPECIES: bifunctional DNA-formamidopyrimidine glycosylase/DNA-(apurinic or apyrimidinic site) lyase [Alcanivorax]MBG33095.1 DNA-formamidopyrimidine glycosylase [Alcanivorax sp.]MDF1636000.1 bifunctional DNA-formamidopyrimidine glycosylase/DNA-(apurinic or apyrimidinic site) lyase [Alcanivorax jadensis]|tara:strand:- start:1793 stop:2602 length:810 start_codon:yes stop_codon:yes gene_type:complete